MGRQILTTEPPNTILCISFPFLHSLPSFFLPYISLLLFPLLSLPLLSLFLSPVPTFLPLLPRSPETILSPEYDSSVNHPFISLNAYLFLWLPEPRHYKDESDVALAL